MPDSSTSDRATSTTASNPYNALAAYIRHAAPGENAALARLSVERALRPHEIAALSRALLAAGLDPEKWRPDTWQRWALVAHGIALAGHDAAGRLGAQLARAGVAESRVTRLLTARGGAFVQLLPRVLRLLASKNVRPNWYELGPLVLKQESSDRSDIEQTEQIRLRIAGAYFSEAARNAA